MFPILYGHNITLFKIFFLKIFVDPVFHSILPCSHGNRWAYCLIYLRVREIFSSCHVLPFVPRNHESLCLILKSFLYFDVRGTRSISYISLMGITFCISIGYGGQRSRNDKKCVRINLLCSAIFDNKNMVQAVIWIILVSV